MGVEVQPNAQDSQLYQKGVKHLYENGVTRLPSRYILPLQERPDKNEHGAVGNAAMSKFNLSLPIIDFSQINGSNRALVLKSMADACRQYGFFQVVNHGIPTEVMKNMIDVSTGFFELPFEERAKYMSSNMFAPVRYGTSFNQNKDNVFCWRDFLKLMCHPMAHVLSQWPSSPVDFRDMAAAYARETKYLYMMLMDAILEGLGVSPPVENTGKEEEEEEEENNDGGDDDDDYEIFEKFRVGSQLMVMNCYPPCPEPNLTLGMPPHSDYGFLTLLLQDEVEGLQIQYQGKWVTVEPISNAFVVNVGDHLEIFSNGRYKSVLHRVVANSTKHRISVASLHSLPFECVIRPSSKLINEDNPRRYKDTDFATFLDYITSCEPKKKNFLESRKLTPE